MKIQANQSQSLSLKPAPATMACKAVAKNRHTRAPKDIKNNGALHKHYKIQ
jgi:hypothetical protein